MPYRIIKEKSGFFVEDIKTHRKLSKKPLTKKMAHKQEIAVAISEHKRHPKKSVSSYFA